MAQQLMERRANSRYGHPTISGIRAVLRPGHAVGVLNLSGGGALILGARPLRPNSRVFLQITVAGQTGGRASRVLRCAVASLDGPNGIQYCSAIQFDEQWETLWERCILDACSRPEGLGRVQVVTEEAAEPKGPEHSAEGSPDRRT